MSNTPDLSEFDKLNQPRSQKRPCKFDPAYQALASEEREQVTAAIDAGYGPGVIQKWLAARGHDIHLQAVANHIKRGCTCADG